MTLCFTQNHLYVYEIIQVRVHSRMQKSILNPSAFRKGFFLHTCLLTYIKPHTVKNCHPINGLGILNSGYMVANGSSLVCLA